MTESRGIVGPEVLESMQALANNRGFPMKVHPVLLDYNFAVIGYKAKEKALQLAYPTQKGLDWMHDTMSNGKLGAAWHFSWWWEQRAKFYESVADFPSSPEGPDPMIG